MLCRLLLVLAACLGCAPATDPPPNLILVSLDALRTDHLSLSGYPRETSPFLDAVAANGAHFPQAIVNTHGTPPSHTTLLTGLHQRTHRVSIPPYPGMHWAHVAPAELVTLPERLAERGYTSLAVTGGGLLSARFGLDQGFAVFDDEPRDVAQAAARLLEHLDAHTDPPGPRFLFFHTYEIHSPYLPPPEYAARFPAPASDLVPLSENLVPLQERADTLRPEDLAFLRARYDAGIRYTDDVMRGLFAELARRGILENALVLITSDHGEEFGEHGGLLHRGLLYDELLRVPLILAGPGVRRGPDPRLASSIDVTPTLLGAAGIPVPPELPGRDLRGPPPPEPDAVVAEYAEQRVALRTARYKWIENAEGPPELYDLAADPVEQQDLSQTLPKVAAGMAARLARWRDATPRSERDPTPLDLSEEELAHLRSLGYGD